MNTLTYNLIAGILVFAILYGLSLMSKVQTAVRGNLFCASAMGLAIIVTMYKDSSLASASLWLTIFMGVALGLTLSNKVKMIQMPQMVAFLHGIGGGTAAIVGLLVLVDTGAASVFERSSAGLALIMGMVTIAGSFVAAGKLHQILPQKPLRLPNHSRIINILLGIMAFSLFICTVAPNFLFTFNVCLMFASGALFGAIFTVRVGGADMPITISLLNSMGGVSAAIAGFAIADPLLVAIGGIIGSSGFLLTRIMCRAMNRKLFSILVGESSVPAKAKVCEPASQQTPAPQTASKESPCSDIAQLLTTAKNVIIVPGYGMALAQAQYKVKQLADTLEAKGANVQYAVHPVAGRMPGHMNVLLAEANVDYENLLEMDTANPLFASSDLVIIIGANDVVNPAANSAADTPIYGMPILKADEAKNIIICNYDTKPGYAGVDNPLYTKLGVIMMTGDAATTVSLLIDHAKGTAATPKEVAATLSQGASAAKLLTSAKTVLIVPGYGMALAQAQYKVKQLADALEAKGASVQYAVHPVAGRMPGHMNVLLAEANVDYERLLEMDTANPLFASTDLVIIIGANDVVNPAANTAEDTPIYGMPILKADDAKNIIICNYDTKPGYAGVDNPLYTKPGVLMMTGDAATTVSLLIDYTKGTATTSTQGAAPSQGASAAKLLTTAKTVLIVPGYGMALAQAQYKVKQLADALEAKGASVQYAVHPVAGRMPGHMNVLLAEANVDYEHLLEMDTANPLFASADLVIVIGANDVVNPAANTAEDTPIYGMPILKANAAKNIIICNYDTKPGYAGVDNPLYTKENVLLFLGDASESVGQLIDLARQ